jgi:hypothetical protein
MIFEGFPPSPPPCCFPELELMYSRIIESRRDTERERKTDAEHVITMLKVKGEGNANEYFVASDSNGICV